MVRAEHQYECPDCHSQVRATCEVNRDLLDVAESLVRQVEEFSRWDEKDWSAAYAALQAHAVAALKAITKAGGK